jgi:hypothetical protein
MLAFSLKGVNLIRNANRRAGSFGHLLVLAALLAGCAIRLAPSYDAVIVAGLTKANEQAMTVFAAVSEGVAAGTFAEREPFYNEAIGTADATRLLADARPNPPTANLIKVKTSDPQGEGVKEPMAPSPLILGNVVQTLTSMREVDRAGGLSASLAKGFKQRFEILMDQVLTYEKALQR